MLSSTVHLFIVSKNEVLLQTLEQEVLTTSEELELTGEGQNDGIMAGEELAEEIMGGEDVAEVEIKIDFQNGHAEVSHNYEFETVKNCEMSRENKVCESNCSPLTESTGNTCQTEEATPGTIPMTTPQQLPTDGVRVIKLNLYPVECGCAGKNGVCLAVSGVNIAIHNVTAFKDDGNPVFRSICAVCLEQFTERFCLHNHMKHHVCTTNDDTIRTEEMDSFEDENSVNTTFEQHGNNIDLSDIEEENSLEQTNHDVDSTQINEPFSEIINTIYDEKLDPRTVWYTCEFCKKRFLEEKYLRKHRYRQHLNDPNTFKCSHCGKGYRDNEYLKRHIRLTHSTVRPHLCSICGKGFALIYEMKTHERSHTSNVSQPGEFICQICGKGYAHKTTLSQHMYTHGGVKQHSCDICGMKFMRVGDMNKHKARHRTKSDRTRYTCVDCNLNFTKYQLLKWHYRQHHPIEPLPSPFKIENHP